VSSVLLMMGGGSQMLRALLGEAPLPECLLVETSAEATAAEQVGCGLGDINEARITLD
jgi:hypothetical protein